MGIRWFAAAGMLLFGLVGCLGSLAPSSTPPKIYRIDAPSVPVSCPQRFEEGVKVWNLSASAPYDREEMIVLDPSREVRSSAQFRWVAVPGTLVAESLLRDLSQSDLFSKVVSSGSTMDAALALGGHLFRFAWEEQTNTARAVLDVEMTLWQERPKRTILFRHTYHFESAPDSSQQPEAFARAMSALVEQFSQQLREDLCATRKGSSSTGSSSPTGG